MINKVLWGLLYLIACLTFFHELEYPPTNNIVISIGITALLIHIVYGSYKNDDKLTNCLDYHAVLFLVSIAGPMISSSSDMALGRPFMALSFYYGLYLAVQYCRREGLKPLTIIQAAILSIGLFYLAQKWLYIPFVAVSAILGWFSYSSKTKS